MAPAPSSSPAAAVRAQAIEALSVASAADPDAPYRAGCPFGAASNHPRAWLWGWSPPLAGG